MESLASREWVLITRFRTGVGRYNLLAVYENGPIASATWIFQFENVQFISWTQEFVMKKCDRPNKSRGNAINITEKSSVR